MATLTISNIKSWQHWHFAAASGDQDWKLAGKSGQSSSLFLVFRLLLPTGPFSKHFHLECLNISFFHKT